MNNIKDCCLTTTLIGTGFCGLVTAISSFNALAVPIEMWIGGKILSDHGHDGNAITFSQALSTFALPAFLMTVPVAAVLSCLGLNYNNSNENEDGQSQPPLLLTIALSTGAHVAVACSAYLLNITDHDSLTVQQTAANMAVGEPVMFIPKMLTGVCVFAVVAGCAMACTTACRNGRNPNPNAQESEIDFLGLGARL